MADYVITESRTRVDLFGELRVAQLVRKMIVHESALDAVVASYGFPKRHTYDDHMRHENRLVRWDKRGS